MKTLKEALEEFAENFPGPCTYTKGDKVIVLPAPPTLKEYLALIAEPAS